MSNAARDTYIEVDILADANPLRELNQQVNQITQDTRTMDRSIQDVTRRTIQGYDRMGMSTNWMMMNTRGMSQEALEMHREMSNAFREQKQSMIPFNEELLKSEHAFFKLTQSSKDYQGTSAEFLREVEQLGKEHKRVTDNMIAQNELAKMSMIRAAATALNMTSQATRINQTYERLGNPFYSVNRYGLRFAETLDGIANRGNASVLALKMLGPTASMKQLRDLQMQITQGVMRFQMVAMSAAVTSTLLYSSLHKAAMESNKGYAKSFETMTANLRKAFQPMVDVFAMVMIKVFDFINAIAKMMIQFNEAHPALAKMLQGFLMLIPALTLILSPLAIGIGLTNGLLAAFSSVYLFIKPLVIGMAAMSGTVTLVAGTIVILTAGLIWLYKNNEKVRDVMQSAWKVIEKVVVSAVNTIIAILPTVKNAFNAAFGWISNWVMSVLPVVVAFLSNSFAWISEQAEKYLPIVGNVFTSMFGNVTGGLGSFVNDVMSAFQNLSFEPLLKYAKLLLPTLIGLFIGGIPRLIFIGLNIIRTIANGMGISTPELIEMATNVVIMLINGFFQSLPGVLNVGIQIITKLLDGILGAIPQIIGIVILLINTFVQAFITLLPILVPIAVSLITTLINGIATALPMIIQAVILIINSFVQMFVIYLPLIINSGIQILMALIQGIVSLLPTLIQAAINLIVSIFNAIIANLPAIISAGIQVILALINGLIQVLPQLISAAIQIIIALIGAILQNLPAILSAGVQLILALIKGLLQMIGSVVSSAGQIGKTILEEIKKIDLFQIGIDIIQGLINGMGSMIGSVVESVKNVAGSVKDAITGFLDIHSPSRLMFELGGFTTEGFALGITDQMKMVNQASKSMALSAVPNTSVLSEASLSVPDTGYTPTSSNTTNSSKKVNVNAEFHIYGGSDEKDSNGKTVKEQLEEGWEELMMQYRDEVEI